MTILQPPEIDARIAWVAVVMLGTIETMPRTFTARTVVTASDRPTGRAAEQLAVTFSRVADAPIAACEVTRAYDMLAGPLSTADIRRAAQR